MPKLMRHWANARRWFFAHRPPVRWRWVTHDRELAQLTLFWSAVRKANRYDS